MTTFDVFWLLTRITFWSAGVSFLLFVFFAAVMGLRDARNRGVLIGPLEKLGCLTLAIGYGLDFFVQMTIAVAVFAEIPPVRWFTPGWSFRLAGVSISFGWLRLPAVEPTVSERMKRLRSTGTGWRQARAEWWLVKVLGPLDTSGGHS